MSVVGDRSTHDSLRNGSHAKLMDKIRVSGHRRLFVHSTLNRRNWEGFPAVAGELSSLHQVRGLTVQFFYPYNQGEDDLRLSAEERRKAVEMVIGLKREGYPVMNSVRGLRSMISNDWRCHDWLLANVDPDGSIDTGCYVRNRGRSDAASAGSRRWQSVRAYDLRPGSLVAGGGSSCHDGQAAEPIIDFHVHLFPDELLRAIWSFFKRVYGLDVVHRLFAV